MKPINGNTANCADIDECAKAEDNDCDTNALCSNNRGSFTCFCKSGYEGSGKKCTDVNECLKADLNNCSPNANCTNLAGSAGKGYSCECKRGFTGDGETCKNTNECTGNHLCHQNAICEDTVGMPLQASQWPPGHPSVLKGLERSNSTDFTSNNIGSRMQ